MIEIMDPEILSLISGSLVVVVVVMYAWRSGFYKKQLNFAKALPENLSNQDFLTAVLFNSLPVIIEYFKWLIGYFIKIGWYLLIFTIISININDFEFSFLIILAIVTAKATSSNSQPKKGEKVIILSQAEHERILNGKAKMSDFSVEK